jgi:hypothetical protein
MSRKPGEWARWSLLVALSLSFHAVHAASCEDVRVVVVSSQYNNVHVAFSGGSAYVTSYATGALENLPLVGTMLGGCPLPDNPTYAYAHMMTSGRQRHSSLRCRATAAVRATPCRFHRRSVVTTALLAVS